MRNCTRTAVTTCLWATYSKQQIGHKICVVCGGNLFVGDGVYPPRGGGGGVTWQRFPPGWGGTVVPGGGGGWTLGGGKVQR